MLTKEFFEQFRSVSIELGESLKAMSVTQGTSREVQKEKIRILVETAGLTMDQAREYVQLILREPDDRGHRMMA